MQVSQTLANQIAASLDYPDLPNEGAGIYAIYANHRYQLVKRNGQYMAFDVSVYAEDGTLLTDSWDVYIHALYEAGVESVEDMKVLGVSAGVLAVIGVGVYLFLVYKKVL